MKQRKETSIFKKLIIPMLVIVAIQSLVFISVIFYQGTTGKLRKNSIDAFQWITTFRKTNLETNMVRNWASYTNFENIVNKFSDSIKQNGAIIDKPMAESLIEFLRHSKVTGAFIVLEDGYSSKIGYKSFYIRDLDPITASFDNSDILVEVGPSKVIKEVGLTMNSTWSTRLKLNTGNVRDAFYFKPFRAVQQNPGGIFSNYGYWSPPFRLSKNDIDVISYSVPIVDDEGNFQGVVGIDISIDYLKKNLPYEELNDSLGRNNLDGLSNSAYFIATTNDGESYKNVLKSGVLYDYAVLESNSFKLHNNPVIDGMYMFNLFSDSNDHEIISLNNFTLYESDSPFSDEQWVLCGMTKKSALLNESNSLISSLLIAFVFSILIGVLGQFVFSLIFTRPIVSLQNIIKNSSPEKAINLHRVYIKEIDNLSETIEMYSNSMAEYALRDKMKLEFELDHDLLTNLLNRYSFNQKVNEVIKNGIKGVAAMVMWDLDNLKFINDSYGHDVGDRFLIEFSNKITALSNNNAIIARRSGDEFFAFIYNLESKELIEELIHKNHAKLHETAFKLPGNRITRFRASSGYAWYPNDADTCEILVKYADFAMYSAKRTIKGTVKEFDLDAFKRDEFLLEGSEDLNLFFEYSMVKFAFQPIVDVKNGEIYAYEALMRPTSEKLKSINEVIRLAKEQSKLYQLELLTWNGAVEACKNQETSFGDKKLFINSISNTCLSDEDLEKFENKHGDFIKKLVIEISEREEPESEFMDRKFAFADRWNLDIAIDDFGSGYNTEKVLLNISPNFVKIDISLVRGINKDHDRQNFLLNMINYIKARDAKLIAEGVETKEELITLINLGVDYVQGYYLGRPEFDIKDIALERKQELIKYNKRKLSSSMYIKNNDKKKTDGYANINKPE
jgi:diguanylate cyclase (GGDEF)-like protein